MPVKIKLPVAYVKLTLKKSVSVAGRQNEKNKARDEGHDKEHPVLAIEAEDGKVLDQKVQRSRAPIFRAR
ncbi:hypothetical protein [Bradyrhizobium sp.]|jgi:hypothetical protein|uniref:hypothetical protein n=1 Tax=Bradyrhizobium sp. TaxID=376 RepID=UPI003C344C22